MRVKLVEKVGVSSVVAIAFAVVLVYSLWGASLLHGQKQAVAHDPASRLSANL
jgi:hypothetical protein